MLGIKEKLRNNYFSEQPSEDSILVSRIGEESQVQSCPKLKLYFMKLEDSQAID